MYIIVFFFSALKLMNFLSFYFQDAGGGSIIWTFLPFIFIFGIFYFLVIMPQRRQAKELQMMIAELKINDEVVTNGGIIGKVSKVVDDVEVELQIAEGVKVRAMRGLIAEVRVKAEPVPGATT